MNLKIKNNKIKKNWVKGSKNNRNFKILTPFFSICDFFTFFKNFIPLKNFFQYFFYKLFVFPNILVQIFWKSCKNSGHGISFKIIFMFQIKKNEVLSQITLIFRYLNWQNYEITDMNIYIFWNIWSWTLKKKEKKN